MTLQRLFGPVALALALAGPHPAGAQTTAPATDNSLAAQTKSYFTAILHADTATLSNDTSRTFHLIQSDGTRLGYNQFISEITKDYMMAQPPMGVNVDVKSSNVADGHATETVQTLTWFYGALSTDPMSGPVTARDSATHQLTWSKTASGKWVVDEDHITWVNLS